VQNAPFVETREDLPKDQDHSPSMIAFNKSFGMFYWGELQVLVMKRLMQEMAHLSF
jgi:hypothetical protein